MDAVERDKLYAGGKVVVRTLDWVDEEDWYRPQPPASW